MSYIALYREWRPQTFADMVGQEHIRTTLQNAIRYERFAHAYLFSGPRGTGKTSTAKIFAKAINCEHGPAIEPCNVCNTCRGITEGSIMDVVEIDAASNRGVDEIRDLRDQVKYAPTEARFKVYIIDEVHMLTAEAFNALLKTLEEPPRHVVFILATTESHKLPATIISRCQRFDFKRIQGKDIVGRLKQIAQDKQIEVEEQALWFIARAADGGMRDALSIFDQVISFGEQNITTDLIVTLLGAIRTDVLRTVLQSILKGDTAAALREFSELVQAGKDPTQCIHDLLQLTRDLLMYKTVPELPEIKERLEYDPDFAQLGEEITVSDASYLMEQLTIVQTDMRWHANARLLAETAIIRLSQRQSETKDDLWERIRQLEQKIEGAMLRVSERGSVTHTSDAQPMAANDQFGIESMQDRTVGNRNDANQATLNRGKALGKPQPSIPVRMQEPTTAAAGKIKAVDPELFHRIKERWTDILEEVKRRKITAQAWLLDGEPVAVADEQLYAAFKNQIHRETVMKPINKNVIDEVLSHFAGGKLELVALSKSEWAQLETTIQSAVSNVVAVSKGDPDQNGFVSGTNMDQIHDVSEGQQNISAEASQSEQDEMWIQKTKELFGSDNVCIVKEERS